MPSSELRIALDKASLNSQSAISALLAGRDTSTYSSSPCSKHSIYSSNAVSRSTSWIQSRYSCSRSAINELYHSVTFWHNAVEHNVTWVSSNNNSKRAPIAWALQLHFCNQEQNYSSKTCRSETTLKHNIEKVEEYVATQSKGTPTKKN